MSFHRLRREFPIYDSIYFDIIISDSTEEINKELAPEDQEEEFFACASKVTFQNEKGLNCKSIQVILCEENPNNLITPRIIVHETVHVKNMLFGIIGYRQADDNDEAEAYFTEWIFQEITNFFEECQRYDAGGQLKLEL